MAFLKKTGKKLGKILLNKYLIVFLAYTVFVTFFDQHSLIHRWQTHQKITQLEKEYKFYQEEIKSNRQKKYELQSSNNNLEKFAREHYYMKKENEDIFIVKE
jgi:cell division protein DivIC